MFGNVTNSHYQCIHADVPWRFKSWSAAGEERSAQHHYRCMSIADIARLPVLAAAAPDCHLFFWITGPMLVLGNHLRIMRSWGFEPTAMAFVWVKTNHKNADLFMGLGHTTRQNAEYCILGRRGSPVRLSKSVRQIIMSPVREHSRKPDEVYRRIESYCAGPRLDIFGRRQMSNWTVVGDEATKFDREEDNDKTARVFPKQERRRKKAQ